MDTTDPAITTVHPLFYATERETLEKVRVSYHLFGKIHTGRCYDETFARRSIDREEESFFIFFGVLDELQQINHKAHAVW